VKIPHDRWPRLLALAAHELRTPAGVVSGYTRMLLQGRAGELAGPQRALLETADRSNDRLAELVAQMSDLARLEDGTAPLALSVGDLAAVLASPGEPTALPTPVAPFPPVKLSLDASRVRRAFAALAALHRRKGASDPVMAARAGAGSIWLAVGAADAAAEGLAAPADGLEPFDDLQGGLGLELALARAVVEGHGGAIFTRSGAAPQHEVTVIRLPLAEAP